MDPQSHARHKSGTFVVAREKLASGVAEALLYPRGGSQTVRLSERVVNPFGRALRKSDPVSGREGWSACGILIDTLIFFLYFIYIIDRLGVLKIKYLIEKFWFFFIGKM